MYALSNKSGQQFIEVLLCIYEASNLEEDCPETNQPIFIFLKTNKL